MGEQNRSGQFHREMARDRRIDLWAWLIVSAILIGFFSVDVLSEMTDAAYAGKPGAWHRFFFFDGTSNLVLVTMLPLLLWFTRRVPFDLADWKTSLPLYALASLVWSVVHVGAMVVLRKLLYPAFFDGPYRFERIGGIGLEFLYEYRKDLLGFAVFIGIIYAIRRIAELRRELEVAREEAGRTARLTLKSGGSTLFLDAGAIDWAKAAGNYVEISAGGRIHLARITLTALEDQLGAAGAGILRTHRSWLVNGERIAEIRPTGDGDQVAMLSTGDEVPVSRRYRESVAADRSLSGT